MATRYWVGGGSAATWAATGNTNWGSASNTQDNAAVPGVGDDVIFDGVGTGASNSTLGANISVKSVNFTGYANTLTHSAGVTLTVGSAGQVGGVCTFVAGMTYSPQNTTTSVIQFTADSGTNVFDPGGKDFSAVTINAPGATVQLAGALDCTQNASSSSITLTAGTFDANNQNVACGNFSSSNSNTRAILFGSGTWTLGQANGTAWTCATSTGLTNTPGTATIVLSGTGTTLRTFAGGGATGGYPTIQCNGGAVAITGANTFAAITMPTPSHISFPATVTTIITAAPSWVGTLANPILISSNSNTATATVQLGTAGGVLTYAALKDITFTTNLPTITQSFDLDNNNSITVSAPSGGGARVIGG